MLIQNFKLKPSKQYLVLLSGVLLVSVAITFSFPIGIGLKVLILSAIAPYGAWMVWQFGLLRSPSSIFGLQCDNNGRWMIQTAHGTYPAQLGGDSTVTRWICVLRFQTSAYRWPKTCLVFSDSLVIQQYRQLLVMLRMY